MLIPAVTLRKIIKTSIRLCTARYERETEIKNIDEGGRRRLEEEGVFGRKNER